MTHKVYVYGTLRQGSADTVLVPGYVYDLGWFPGLELRTEEVTESRVVCEIRTVTESELSFFDKYEGYDPDNPDESLYLRQPYQDGWIYVYNGDLGPFPVIESGDWFQYKGL